MSCNLAHPAQLNQQASCHRQPRETERGRSGKRKRERGRQRERVEREGANEEALEVSAMNFNACNGSSNTSCQDMHMNGSQGPGRGVQRRRGGVAFASLAALCLLNCVQGQKQAASNNFSSSCSAARCPARCLHTEAATTPFVALATWQVGKTFECK